MIVQKLEHGLLGLVLILMTVLPVGEMVVRTAFGGGIPGSLTLTQQGTLWLAFLGAAVAADQDRLLAFDLLKQLLKGQAEQRLALVRNASGAAICLWLAYAAWGLVESEMGSTETVGLGIPSWAAQAVMPVGFGLLALRQWLLAGDSWRVRAVVLPVILAVGLVPIIGSLASDGWYYLALVFMAGAMLAGAPIFTVIGGIAVVFFMRDDVPAAAVAAETYRIVASPTLPTIPLFTLAGMLLSAGASSQRLVRLFRAWFGWMPGGVAVAAVVICAFFTSFTGASGVTILAMGGLLLPMLMDNGYSRKRSLGLITGTGSIGLMFPPSLPLILYAVIAGQAINQMFVAALLPGTLMTLMGVAWAVYIGVEAKAPKLPFALREAFAATKASLWEVLFPVWILVGIFGGFLTVVEAAALSVVYAFVVEFLIYRDLSVGTDLLKVLVDTGVMVGGVLIIVGAAFGLTSYLVDAMIPEQIIEWIQANIESRWVLLLLLNLVLLVVGALMDIFSAIVVVAPLLVPVAQAYDIHPFHLGAIFLSNLEVGYLTPPIGLNLFLSSYRFNEPLGKVFVAALPVFLISVVAVLVITYVPELSTWLPAQIFGP